MIHKGAGWISSHVHTPNNLRTRSHLQFLIILYILTDCAIGFTHFEQFHINLGSATSWSVITGSWHSWWYKFWQVWHSMSLLPFSWLNDLQIQQVQSVKPWLQVYNNELQWVNMYKKSANNNLWKKPVKSNIKTMIIVMVDVLISHNLTYGCKNLQVEIHIHFIRFF